MKKLEIRNFTQKQFEDAKALMQAAFNEEKRSIIEGQTASFEDFMVIIYIALMKNLEDLAENYMVLERVNKSLKQELRRNRIISPVESAIEFNRLEKEAKEREKNGGK